MDFRLYEVDFWGALMTEDEDPSEHECGDKIGDGFIKWDGCMEINVHQHFCQYRAAMSFAHVMHHIYATAHRVIPRFDSALAGYPPKEEVKP